MRLLKIAFSKSMTMVTAAIALLVMLRGGGVVDAKGVVVVLLEGFSQVSRAFWAIILWPIGISLNNDQSAALTLSIMIFLPANIYLGRIIRATRATFQPQQSSGPWDIGDNGGHLDITLTVLWLMRITIFVFTIFHLISAIIISDPGRMTFSGYMSFSLVFWILIGTKRYAEARSMMSQLLGALLIIFFLMLAGFVEFLEASYAP